MYALAQEGPGCRHSLIHSEDYGSTSARSPVEELRQTLEPIPHIFEVFVSEIAVVVT